MKTISEQSIMQSWNSTEIIVSICCTAYNHEQYIEQTLNSFLEQKTNFPFEIIISDDCSTDATTDIIKQYVKAYPNIIKPIYQKENQYSKGALPIRDFILPNVAGKYIALCEGDDYWADAHKLQQQIDLLERNHTLMGCGHNTRFIKNGVLTDKLFLDPDNTQDTYTFDDIIDSAYFHTTSLVYRYSDEHKKEIDEYLSKYSCVDRNDYYMLLVFSKFGEIGYINKIMSVYRLNDGGIWSGADDEAQLIMFLKGCIAFSGIFGSKYKFKFLYSFANTMAEQYSRLSSDFFSKTLSDLDNDDCMSVIEYLTMFKKKDNNMIKECSEYISFLENQLNDNSFKSLVIKFIKVSGLYKIINYVRGNIQTR